MTIDLRKLELAKSYLREFVENTNRSQQHVESSGVIIDELFPDDEVFHDLVVASACYEPCGGELLFDEETILPIYVRCLKRIERIIKESLRVDPD